MLRNLPFKKLFIVTVLTESMSPQITMCPPSNKIYPSYWDLSFRERDIYGSEEEKAKPGFDGAPSGVAHPSTKPNDLFHTGKMKNKPPCDAHKLVPSLPTYPPKETFRDCGTTRSQALSWEDIFAGAPTIGSTLYSLSTPRDTGIWPRRSRSRSRSSSLPQIASPISQATLDIKKPPR